MPLVAPLAAIPGRTGDDGVEGAVEGARSGAGSPTGTGAAQAAIHAAIPMAITAIGARPRPASSG
jgi:hypothetical protein